MLHYVQSAAIAVDSCTLHTSLLRVAAMSTGLPALRILVRTSYRYASTVGS